ncbi:MAG: ParB/RepB/Spo0J family partition protein [Rikenellaceae bacterium]
MKSIIYISTSAIKPDPRNPRRTFNEAELAELAESIKQIGVLQPITVRPLEVGFQLVCGERRWRASQMAELDTIPAIVRKLSDDEAMDFAITENLQRKDVSPIEEADAFNYLIEKGSTIADLCARFGKSEFYVRGRLRLNQLSVEFKALVESGEVIMSQAMELAKFDSDIQAKAYEDWERNQWGGALKSLNSKSLYAELGRRYTNNLDNQDFDTTQCLTCEKCSKVFSLFDCDEMLCMDYECMRNKQVDFQLEQAVKLMSKYTSAGLWTRKQNWENPTITAIRSKGYVVAEYTKSLFINATDYKSYNSRAERGEIVIGVEVGNGTPSLIQINDDFSKATGVVQSNDTQVKALRDQDVRNAEIAEEKSVSDVNKYAAELDLIKFRELEMSSLELHFVVYNLLCKMTTEQQKAIEDFEGYGIPETTAWSITTRALSNRKDILAYIYRCTIINNFGNTYRKGFNTEKFFEWVNSLDGNVTDAIEATHHETYLKRKARLEERIAELSNEKEAK